MGQTNSHFPSFPSQDREKSQNIPDDWISYDILYSLMTSGFGVGMRRETSAVVQGIGAGLGHIFIKPKRRVWPRLKVVSW